jgi:signal transduction histidine kinase
VIGRTQAVLDDTVRPLTSTIFDWQPNGVLRRFGATNGAAEVTLPPDFARRAEDGEILARYEWEDGSGRPLPAIWKTLGADLLIPIGSGRRPVAVLALAAKQSGRPYGSDDVVFLRAAASQVALGLTNARAFAQLGELNVSLEEMVVERTAKLNRSLEELRAAYQQLELNQASLMRADRLATLGRLAAGLAHEVNTPLGATLNSLGVLGDLGQEYADSIDDPNVTTDDHRQIAAELIDTTRAATTWARKAAAFIAKVKMHGREPQSGGAETFQLGTVVAETQALLAHRLRASSCQLEIVEGAEASLVGDPMRLGQVLVNLVTNAVDAYEDARIFDGRIEVRARPGAATTVVTVRDWAGGIPAAVLPRIFDELFTTKEPGRGTGLGLWIARNLVEQVFGGTLTVDTEPGLGSCFTLTLPVEGAAAAPPPDAAPAAAEFV